MIKPILYSQLTPELARKGCFVTGMPNEDYHAYEGISKSGLDLIARSPAHYKYARRKEPSRAMVLGSAIHAAILEPELFASQYVMLEDAADRRCAEYRRAIKETPEEFVLVASEAELVLGMSEQAMLNDDLSSALSSEHYTELSAFVECPETGVLLRARFDLITADGLSIDLKKTRDARPEQFSKSVNEYRYHVQDALYSYVYELITGKPIKGFKFAAVEEQAPHTFKVYELDEFSKMAGNFFFKRDLDIYAQCVKSGVWPHFETEGVLTLPAWAAKQFEDEFYGETE